MKIKKTQKQHAKNSQKLQIFKNSARTGRSTWHIKKTKQQALCGQKMNKRNSKLPQKQIEIPADSEELKNQATFGHFCQKCLFHFKNNDKEHNTGKMDLRTVHNSKTTQNPSTKPTQNQTTANHKTLYEIETKPVKNPEKKERRLALNE